jgi:hypothetical protein
MQISIRIGVVQAIKGPFHRGGSFAYQRFRDGFKFPLLRLPRKRVRA